MIFLGNIHSLHFVVTCLIGSHSLSYWQIQFGNLENSYNIVVLWFIEFCLLTPYLATKLVDYVMFCFRHRCCVQHLVKLRSISFLFVQVIYEEKLRCRQNITWRCKYCSLRYSKSKMVCYGKPYSIEHSTSVMSLCGHKVGEEIGYLIIRGITKLPS